MKNFTKILVAVVALVALSCTTDTTQEMGVDLGNNNGLTKISLSLEESRTQLGEKAGDLYPLYWGEGDQISINGVASTPLSADAAGSTNATFLVEGSPAKPYCIAYPAASAGQVLFAEKQLHAGNSTFANGVTTLYGYSADGVSAKLTHLTGILKISVVGSAKLVLAQISTIDRKPIAGAFDFDFESGEATATSASKDVIEYSFGEGVQLSAEATNLHIAVPAGEYDELYITLYDENGGVMYATAKADESKPLNAGNVREFPRAITYHPNSNVFIVKDKASLKAFAEQAATLTKDVLFVADVDMTGEAWTPIEGYAKTVIGNGYAIKGLTAPLFGVTNASFKGLHLRDVNINETVTPIVGALARRVTAVEGNFPTISNCSVSGTITVDVKDFAPTVAENQQDSGAAGLVGQLAGATISDCVNEATLDIKQMFSESTTVVVIANGGGVVGLLHNAVGADGETIIGSSTIENCVNRGKVTYTNATTAVSISTRIGGLIGNALRGAMATGLVNYGDISTKGPFGSTHTNNLGGVLGFSNTAITLNDSKNYGTISCSGGDFGALIIAGVAGMFGDCAGTQLHNYGAVIVAEDVKAYQLLAGGAVGRHTGTADIAFSILSHCSNNAPVTVLGGMKQDETTAKKGYCHIGGAVAWSQNNDHDIVNNAEGVVTVKSTLINAEDNVFNLSIGGGLGYQTQNGSIEITNHAPINVECTVNTLETYTDYESVRLYVGGAVGYINSEGDLMSGLSNTGNLTVFANTVGNLRVGGAYGQNAGGAIDGAENSGKITIKEGTTTGTVLMVGGVCACYAHGTGKNFTNTGDITLEKDLSVGKMFHLGGCVAWTNRPLTTLRNSGNITILGGSSGASANATTNDHRITNVGGNVGTLDVKQTMSDMENSGDITISNYEAKYTFSVGGNIGRYNISAGGSGTDLKNSGTITLDETTKSGGGLYVGGCVALHQGNSGALTNCENDAPITAKTAVPSGNVYIGGVVGYVDGSTDRTLTNTKNGKMLIALTSTGSGKTYAIGGVAGRMVDHSTPLDNQGDITIRGTIKGTAFVAGIIGYPNNYNRVNITNSCDITIDGTFEGSCNIAGINGGGSYSGVYGNTHSSGNILVTKNAIFKGATVIGGIFGKNSASGLVFNSCSSSTNILFEGTSGASGKEDATLCIGGILGETIAIKSVQHGLTCSGNITYSGTHNSTAPVYIGGITGNNSAPLQGTDFLLYLAGTATKLEGEPTATGVIYHDCKVSYLGDITCNGTSTGPVYVGGWAGFSTTSVENGQIYTNMYTGENKNVGMVFGVARVNESVMANNCAVGGASVLYDTEDDEYTLKPLKEISFFDYIYSSGKDTDWTGTTNHDGCTFLSAKPTIE